MSTLFDNLVSGGGGDYFDDLNSAPITGSQPAITSIGALNFNGSATITGSNFGASQGAGSVTIGGVSQPVTAWSATSISIGPIARGALKYGTQNVVVTSSTGGSSTPSAQSFSPQTGWSYVNLVAPLASTGQRITSTPDLAGGDQLAWGDIAPSGSVTVTSDASFTAGTGVGQFSVECNDGTGWGGFAVQFVANVAAFTGSLVSGTSQIHGSFAVQVPSTARAFSGSLQSGAATVSGFFTAFVGRAYSGALVSGPAMVSGSFQIIGAVTNPSAPPTQPIGTGTVAGKIAIVNIGLIALGVPTINSFNDDTKAARLAGQVFDSVRDKELAKYLWKFAICRRSVVQEISDQPRGDYLYSYQKPVDWLRTVWIGDLTLGTALAVDDPGEADWSHEGDFILSNHAPPLPLQYIRRVTDVTKYDVLFQEALSMAVAMLLAEPLTKSTEKWQKAQSQYRAAIYEARRINAIVDPPRSAPSDTWLNARL
jgi:hypothetical protein